MNDTDRRKEKLYPEFIAQIEYDRPITIDLNGIKFNREYPGKYCKCGCGKQLEPKLVHESNLYRRIIPEHTSKFNAREYYARSCADKLRNKHQEKKEPVRNEVVEAWLMGRI